MGAKKSGACQYVISSQHLGALKDRPLGIASVWRLNRRLATTALQMIPTSAIKAKSQPYGSGSIPRGSLFVDFPKGRYCAHSPDSKRIPTILSSRVYRERFDRSETACRRSQRQLLKGEPVPFPHCTSSPNHPL
jgi:hypothetical protein